MDNTERAAVAETAVEAFMNECRTDREDAVGDLICNLMHLAEAVGDDPIRVIKNAISNHFAETHHERDCTVILTVAPIERKRPAKKRSDYAAALKKITEIKANPSSDPDVMGEALAEIYRIATVALA
jgi:hypothetical protein